jgi:hypothetical protein
VQPNVTARDSQSNCETGELACIAGAPGRRRIHPTTGNDPPFFHSDASAPSSIQAARINLPMKIQTGFTGFFKIRIGPQNPDKFCKSSPFFEESSTKVTDDALKQ